MAGAKESPLVRIRGLNKSYARGSRVIPVLRDIDLDIENAGFMALMGPSGSGKSTLLNLIAGIDRPDSGTIEIGGIETTSLAESELASWRSDHVGFIFQFYNLMPVLTALENVELPLLLKDMPRKERRERAGMLLGLVGLSERLDHYPGELSGGEQQRVAISRAMVTDPTILVADEPTGDLDMESAEEVLRLMERLNVEFGKTVILVTHDPKAAGKARTVRRLEKGYLNAAVF
ncbi:MAG: ABC transporter ATP-binding protein [Thermodesulfobacteriota bacterium]|nr:MAG: ABC transporter ATP-binding protein [Thermodesulfobacteriota bacterium]